MISGGFLKINTGADAGKVLYTTTMKCLKYQKKLIAYKNICTDVCHWRVCTINLRSLAVPSADFDGAGRPARLSRMLKDFDICSHDGDEHRRRYLAVKDFIVRIMKALIQTGLTKHNLYQSRRQYKLGPSLVPLVT